MGDFAGSRLPPVRKVITYHRADGKAAVQSNEALEPQALPLGPGLSEIQVWVTKDFPSTDNNSSDDGGQRQIQDAANFNLVEPTGTNLRFTDLAAGAATPWHRTTSIDYNVLTHGELVLLMEDGSETHLKNPGDTVVQKGTMHAWRNPGRTTARWVSVLQPAVATVVDGVALKAEIGAMAE